MPAPAVVAAAAKAGQLAHAARDTRTRARVASLAGGAVAVAVAVPMTAIIIAVGGTRDPAFSTSAAPSAVALADIPAEALHAYQDAAGRWQMDWAILAAIGKVECDHGRTQLAGCNPPDTINSAGARGYMQFIGSTWRTSLGQYDLESRTSPPANDRQGYATDGDSDGDADPWSWPDATHSAARYLAANNVNADAAHAVWQYNHHDAYVTRVLELAASYRAPSHTGPLRLATVEGITVHADIADDVASLIAAARAAGFELTGGGYRDPAEQIALRRSHCGTSDYAIYEMSPSQCSPPTARPGESMHERGLAIDFSCDGALITSRDRACYRWLAEHAPTYGLLELSSGAEPWHFSTDGS